MSGPPIAFPRQMLTNNRVAPATTGEVMVPAAGIASGTASEMAPGIAMMAMSEHVGALAPRVLRDAITATVIHIHRVEATGNANAKTVSETVETAEADLTETDLTAIEAHTAGVTTAEATHTLAGIAI